MIDPADIRIGNYVWYYDYNMIEQAFQVEGIYNGYLYNTSLPQSKITLQKANPCILDLDLLRSFGFLAGDPAYQEDPDMYSLKYNRISSVHVKYSNHIFQPHTDSPIGLVPYGLPLVHVHQLQNWYHALTRDELEALY
ncbi:hypothetical protein GA0116948_101181 [Chitinophaga costaii]|uniref:Uncharacterized protein n=1 Tax=Chitinophaga costaii TaxID=1335309 RepID=A0A1C3Z076_9BACT|nr:hypothetical protein [Chitinophaga costaii]SCB75678.1 hypothetical protein GA0116948_101181 [Chitinophaga costaii]